MTASHFAQLLESKLGQKLVTLVESRGETTIEVLPENWIAVAKELRDDPELRFEQAVDVCGVDYLSYGDVEWDTTTSDQAPYTVRLTMQVEDRKGMLAEISAKVSGINTNITNMEARTGEDQQARIDMTVEISDVKHLERVIKSIKGVQGVLGVERTARA